MDPLGSVGAGFTLDFGTEFNGITLCVTEMTPPGGIEIEAVECPCLNDPLDLSGCAITECDPANRATPKDFELEVKYVCAYEPTCGVKFPVTVTAPDGCQKSFEGFITDYSPNTISADGTDVATASITMKVCTAVTTI